MEHGLYAAVRGAQHGASVLGERAEDASKPASTQSSKREPCCRAHVALPSKHVVAHVVLVNVLEIFGVAKRCEPGARCTDTEGHIGKAVHRWVQHVPHECMEQHAWHEHCKGLQQIEAEQSKHRKGRGEHLDCHQASDLPGECGPAPLVAVEGERCRAAAPPWILLECHIVIRLCVVLHVTSAVDFDLLARITAKEKRCEPLQWARLVELLVLVPAVRDVLVDGHECVECWCCGHTAKSADHLGVTRACELRNAGNLRCLQAHHRLRSERRNGEKEHSARHEGRLRIAKGIFGRLFVVRLQNQSLRGSREYCRIGATVRYSVL